MLKIHAYELLKEKDDELCLVKERTYKYEGEEILNSPESVYNFILNTLSLQNYPEEMMYVIGLNNRGTVRGLFKVGQGTATTSLVNPAGIFKRLLLSDCNNFILTHNHPSNNLEPSQSDIQTTNNLNQLGKLLGVRLLDHLIIGRDSFYSFKQGNFI